MSICCRMEIFNSKRVLGDQLITRFASVHYPSSLAAPLSAGGATDTLVLLPSLASSEFRWGHISEAENRAFLQISPIGPPRMRPPQQGGPALFFVMARATPNTRLRAVPPISVAVCAFVGSGVRPEDVFFWIIIP